jgi:DNA-binding MarR family transcriptional regulator
VRLSAIAAAYRAVGLSLDTRHPEIARALRPGGEKGSDAAVRHSMALRPEILVPLLAHLGDGPKASRDRALLLMGYWLGAAAGELTSLQVDDVSRRARDYLVTGRKQGARIESILNTAELSDICPVLALDAWLGVRGAEVGPLFCHVDRAGRATFAPLDAGRVTYVIKQAARAAGLPASDLSSRSLITGLQQTLQVPFSASGAAVDDSDYRSALAPYASDADGAFDTPLASANMTQSWQLQLSLVIDAFSRVQGAVFDRRMKAMGASRAQFLTLVQVVDNDGIVQSDLATRLHMSKVALSTMINRLQSRGWVERRTDDADARIRRIFATDAARASVSALHEVAEQLTAALFRNVPHSDSERVFSLLTYLSQRLLVMNAQENAVGGESEGPAA